MAWGAPKRADGVYSIADATGSTEEEKVAPTLQEAWREALNCAPVPIPTPGRGRKGKKKEKVVLFATGGRVGM